MTISDTDVARRALIRNSKWPWWSVYPGLAFASWLHLGIITRERKYFWLAALYFAPLLTFGALDPATDAGQLPAIVSLAIMGTWIGGMIHAFRTRRAAAQLLRDIPAPVAAAAAAAGATAAAAAAAAAVEHSDPAANLAIPPAAPPAVRAAEKRTFTERLREFQRDVDIEHKRMKTGIEPGDDWRSARMIAFVPCIEEPDAPDEVSMPWLRPKFIGQVLRLFLSWLVDRRWYCAISVFDDYFYVTQTSHFFGILFEKTRIDIQQRHARVDIVRLVTSTVRDEKMAYSPIYHGRGNWQLSGEVFRLYVRPTAGSATLVKYVFRAANDSRSPVVSLEEALTSLDSLVPRERRTTIPPPQGRKDKLTAARRLEARNNG